MTHVPTLSSFSSKPYVKTSTNVKYVNIIQALIVIFMVCVCLAVDDTNTHANRQDYVQNQQPLLEPIEIKSTTIVMLVNDSQTSGAYIAKNSHMPTPWTTAVRKSQLIQKNNSAMEATREEVEEPTDPIQSNQTSPDTTAARAGNLTGTSRRTRTPSPTNMQLTSVVSINNTSVNAKSTPESSTRLTKANNTTSVNTTILPTVSVPQMNMSTSTNTTTAGNTITHANATSTHKLSTMLTSVYTGTSISTTIQTTSNTTKVTIVVNITTTNLEVTTQPNTGTTNASAPFITQMTSSGTTTTGPVTTAVTHIETTTDACHNRPGIDCETYKQLLDICRKPQQARKICQKYCKLCDLVDGHWSHWSEWKACDVTCHVGTRTKTRECNNPAPVHGGLDCVGKKTEVKPCQLEPCPVHGGWGGWRKWQTCTRSCGLGVQTRVRSCDSQRPDHFGRHCFGEASEIQLCNRQSCPGADGVWTVWSAWSHPCSVTCGGGLRRRIRTCTNPAPSGSGRSCGGDSTQYQTCNGQPCPVAGFWSPWSQWSPWRCQGAATELRSSTRICVGPLYGGDGCQGKGSRQETRNVAICIPDMT